MEKTNKAMVFVGIQIIFQQIILQKPYKVFGDLTRFILFPTPADDYFVVEYELPVYNFKTGNFRMYNADKKKVYEQKLKTL